jgi:hypothetical protein
MVLKETAVSSLRRCPCAVETSEVSLRIVTPATSSQWLQCPRSE